MIIITPKSRSLFYFIILILFGVGTATIVINYGKEAAAESEYFQLREKILESENNL